MQMLAKRVFISPSAQDWNSYAGGQNEEYWMRKVASLVVAELQKYGIVVAMGGTLSATDNANMGNAFDPNGEGLYVALHSNAGGGHGTEVFAYDNIGVGYLLAQNIYNEVAPVSNFPDRGVKINTGYIELNHTKAESVIVEFLFHDNLAEANEMRADYALFGHAVVKGILRTLGISIPAPPIYSGAHVLRLEHVRVERDPQLLKLINSMGLSTWKSVSTIGTLTEGMNRALPGILEEVTNRIRNL